MTYYPILLQWIALSIKGWKVMKVVTLNRFSLFLIQRESFQDIIYYDVFDRFYVLLDKRSTNYSKGLLVFMTPDTFNK